MKFKNNGEGIKIRLKGNVDWINVKAGDEVNLPEEVGLANGLEKIEEVVEKEVEVPKKSKKTKK